jgi:hypothetical protein
MRILTVLLAALLAGCAGLHAEKMVPDETSYGTHHDRTVALSVGGGSGGVRWFSRTVTRRQFEEAVRSAIERSTLFRQIESDATADYILSVDLKFAASHPGFNMTAWVITNWSLVERATGSKAWATEVEGEGSATVGDAFYGGTRQSMALERAGKANIAKALSQVGTLQLNGPTSPSE